MSIVCAWAGSVAGFASGVVGCLLATLQAGATLLRQSECWVCALAAQLALPSAACGQQPALASPRHNATQALPARSPSFLCPPLAGALTASAVASGAGRLAAAASSLATPIVMALLKTLAFTRLFA